MIENKVQPPLKNVPQPAQDSAAVEGTQFMTARATIFTIDWYLRIAGIALIGYACLTTLSQHPSLTAFGLVQGPLLLLGTAGLISSFFVTRSVAKEIIFLLVALLSGVLLFGPTIYNGLTTFVVDTGLDPQRAQLIAALLLTAGTALLGGLCGRRKVGACAGAGIGFWFGYLTNFIQTQLQPTRDPGGNLELLNRGAFLHTIAVMGALALLSAFLGAVVGIALSKAILDPPLQALQLAWRRYVSKQGSREAKQAATVEKHSHRQAVLQRVMYPWLGAGALLVLFVLASFSGPLFIYSPSVGLHSSVQKGSGNQSMPTHGTLVQETMTSQVLGGQSKPLYVYLPPSYNTPQGQNKHYPTLYLLHGSPGTYKDWIQAGNAQQTVDTLIAASKIPELILVIPDGNGQMSPSEWGNSFNQQQPLETYVASELVKYIDQKFRTIPEASNRAIGGLSMGGFGAMNIAVHHPDVFGTVIALGGYYQAEGSVWGNNADYIKQNSPLDVLPNDQQAWKLHIFLGAATQDEPYYSDTMQFAHMLDSLSVPYHLDVQKGSHDWNIWQVQLYNALLWLKWG